MYYLGISGGILPGNQDGAAALIKDGILLSAAEEERFLKIKHAPGLLPTNAIKFCLEREGISIKDISAVSFAGATYDNFKKILRDYFEFNFGYSPIIKLVDHHLAHAASTYYYSDFKKALIITMDFSGDRTSTMAAIGERLKIKEVYRIPKPHSLGVFYSILTQYLGFQKDNDEYKVMGLSAYGKPVFNMNNVIYKKDSKYILNTKYLKTGISSFLPGPSKQEKIYCNNISLPCKGRLAEEAIEQYHMDVAASGQRQLEEIVLYAIDSLVKKTGIRNLCLAGGVALNCLLNQKIKQSGIFDYVFTPPFVSDAGLSIGGATLLSVKNSFKPQKIKNAYLGPEYSDTEIKSILDNSKIKYKYSVRIEEIIADEIAKGKVVGWFQDRMEFGPRALGNRSILADPRDIKIKDRINNMIKFRESFRPFAPVILEEKVSDFFEDATISPFMTSTYNVRPERKDDIPAVIHIDNTSRIQTINREMNIKLHKLIVEFFNITGIPILLNTSLNTRGMPIACTPLDAIQIFFSTGMDIMVLGNFYLTK